MKDNVFFIVGSVRSGTTLLRNILKSHSHLNCPEETHFFRWNEPFASGDYNHINQEAVILQKHRQLDGVAESDFLKILEESMDRKELQLNYFDLFRKAQNNEAIRCFDKTPQNVYGLPLIKAQFPEAKIIHIVRNPLNVVASVKRGRNLLPQSLIGSINFWNEAVSIINVLKPLFNDNLYELKYEDLIKYPEKETSDLLTFLSEEQEDLSEVISTIKTTNETYEDFLSEQEIETVKTHCGELMKVYHY